MRRLVALLLLLAGCLQGAAPDGPEPQDPTPTTGPAPPADGPGAPSGAPGRTPLLTDFAFTGCRGVEVDVSVDVADVQGALPAGYTAWQADAPVAAAGRVRYTWSLCEEFTTSSTQFNGTVHGHVSARIEAPANATQAETHWYLLRMLADPGIMDVLWRAAGYTVHTGNFSRSDEPVDQVTLGGYSVTGPVVSVARGDVGAVAYYTETPAGRLEWSGEVRLESAASIGTLAVPADDPFAAQVPDRPLQVAFIEGAFEQNGVWLRRSG